MRFSCFGAALLALSATAIAQPREAPPAGGLQLFISPAGEPFRAAADEAYPVAKWFAGADVNGDGKLTLAEFLADGDRYFTILDSSRNGVLEPSEIDAYEAAVLLPLTSRPGMSRPETGSPGAGGPPPGGMGGPPPGGGMGRGGGNRRSGFAMGMPSGAGLYGVINIPQPVKAADRDMNAHVTQAEFRKVLHSRFDMLDRAEAEARQKAKKGNGAPTGALTLEELPKTAWQQMNRDNEKKRD